MLTNQYISEVSTANFEFAELMLDIIFIMPGEDDVVQIDMMHFMYGTGQ